MSKALKIIVYTAIFGDKDKGPALVNKDLLPDLDIRFVCVSDNPELKSSDYEIIYKPQQYSDVTKNARNIKLNGIEGIEKYDVAIWHDSSLMIDCAKLVKLTGFAKTHMVSTFHHRRYCAYLEAIACIDSGKDSALRITAQMFRYYMKGFPSNHQLHETGIMVLNCREYFKSELRSIWWNEIKNWSRRDQLSLPYARWKTGVEVGLLAHWTATGSKNEYSTWVGHKHEKYGDRNPFRKINFRIIRIICKKLIFEMRRRR
jgi:hypothetical protein